MIINEQYIEMFDSYLDDRNQTMLNLIKGPKKPKFRISKIPEELRVFQINLDIPYGPKYLLRDKFDWNLNDQHISPKEFIDKFCNKMHITDDAIKQNLYKQLIYQIMDYIERHSFSELETEFKKPQKKKNPYQPKPTARQQKISLHQKVSNRKCAYCQSITNQSSLECKKCNLPFLLSDSLNYQNQITAVCLIFYDLINLKRIKYLQSRKLQKQDFESLYNLKDKLLQSVSSNTDKKIIEQEFQEFMKIKDIQLLKQKYQQELEQQEKEDQEEIDRQKMEKLNEESKIDQESNSNKSQEENSENDLEEDDDDEDNDENVEDYSDSQLEENEQQHYTKLKPNKTKKIRKKNELRRSIRAIDKQKKKKSNNKNYS